MEEIRNWILCVCCVCIAGTLLSLVLPHGGVSDTVICVIRVVAMTVVLVPLFNMNIPLDALTKNIEVPIEDEIQMQEELQTILIDETKRSLHSALDIVIRRHYSGEYEIDSDVDILSDNSIHIKRIYITLLSKTQDTYALREAIQNFCPDCEISFTQGDMNENK